LLFTVKSRPAKIFTQMKAGHFHPISFTNKS
jgi:hypothetical protein